MSSSLLPHPDSTPGNTYLEDLVEYTLGNLAAVVGPWPQPCLGLKSPRALHIVPGCLSCLLHLNTGEELQSEKEWGEDLSKGLGLQKAVMNH